MFMLFGFKKVFISGDGYGYYLKYMILKPTKRFVICGAMFDNYFSSNLTEVIYFDFERWKKIHKIVKTANHFVLNTLQKEDLTADNVVIHYDLLHVLLGLYPHMEII